MSQAIVDEVERGKGSRPRWTPRRLSRHDAHRPARRRDLAAVHAAPLPQSRSRSAGGADPHVPRPPLPERRPRHRH